MTKDSKTLIDIIATNNPATIATSDVIHTSISDHYLVGCIRKLNHRKFPAKTVKCRNYATYDVASMNRDFEEVNWLPVLNTTNVNIALENFNFIMRDIFDNHAPFITKRIKGRPCPWIDDELKRTMNQRDQFLRKARRSNNEEDWKSYKTLRNLCNNMRKKAKATYHKNLINENSRNPKSFWRAVKSIFPTKASSNRNTSNNDQNNKTLAENFKQYFYGYFRCTTSTPGNMIIVL